MRGVAAILIPNCTYILCTQYSRYHRSDWTHQCQPAQAPPSTAAYFER